MIHTTAKYYSEDTSRRMRLLGHEGYMGEINGAYRFFRGKHEGKGHLEYQGLGVRMIMKWIVRECDRGIELDLSGSL
jgi:hypothetical protein